ncbi:hypothetical protein FPOAC2_11743 [Fusarium poae]|uniref:Uncharacterized protein n=1 Tax=Fusarium poae TaxID=36050 RepID=A0A1B8AEK3_FUSPO|nr:hypothetical protein FPOAC1_011437 [Fusarium poae]KAG8666627.1 hypothetical protein FPOAC1_011437 [Fusarium poae]OBS18882.1 hypothetical protein FPOA_10608 [Fusarium poae]
MDSSDYSEAAKAKFRTDMNVEVAAFLQRLQSVGADDEIDDFEVENIREEACILHSPTAPGRSSSGNRFGTTKDEIVQQNDDNNDEAHGLILSHLKMKELAKMKLDKKAEMGTLRESMVRLSTERIGLLWDAELQRRSHIPGDISTDFEMNRILVEYRAHGMEFHELDDKYQYLEKELRRIRKEKRSREKSRQ